MKILAKIAPIWIFLTIMEIYSPTDRGHTSVTDKRALCGPGYTTSTSGYNRNQISSHDNEFQIREAMSDTCQLINSKSSVFEKALLALVLLSYIQAFSDGNKRTARITSNAILIANGYCPLSFRSVDSYDYKKAMLIFYEQNSIYAIKQIFIEQYEFAVREYF